MRLFSDVYVYNTSEKVTVRLQLAITTKSPASHVIFGIYTNKMVRNLSGVTPVNCKSKLPYIMKGFQFTSTSGILSPPERAVLVLPLVVYQQCEFNT